jgi:hypothetical protein
MTPRSKAVLALASAIAILALLHGPGERAPAARSATLGRPVAVEKAGVAGFESVRDETAAKPLAPPAPVPVKLLRGEVAEYLKALYQKEQLAEELALEQRRYGKNYWQSEADGPALATLRAARQAMLARLASELNVRIDELCPDQPGDPVVLRALFDDDRPAPNLSFLSAESRQTFEHTLQSALADGTFDADAQRLLALAMPALPAEQAELYRKWNQPASAALRHQLIGFETSETEFTALLERSRAIASTGEAPNADVTLAVRLGAERYTEYLRLQDPAVQTALHELHRRGLPVQHAEWLATSRAAGSDALQQVWNDPTLPEPSKAERVEAVRRSYRDAINTQLSSTGAVADDNEWML